MLSLFHKKTTLADSGILKGFTDWHCHILPGVDDGIDSVDESLAVLAEYEKAGIAAVWLTPHVMEDMPNSTDALRDALASLEAAYSADRMLRSTDLPKLELHLASENMLDCIFEKRLAARDFLPLPDNRLLVETSYFNPPMDLTGILRSIKDAGYIPVLAHPERYIYMQERDYSELRALGVLFQLNLPSLLGYYGEGVRRKACALLSAGAYALSGTDLHRRPAFAKMIAEKVERGDMKKIMAIGARPEE